MANNNSKTETQTVVANQAAQFIVELYNDAELDYVYANLPEVFIDQVREGKSKFELDKDLVSDSTYSNRARSESDYFRIVIEDPNLSINEAGEVDAIFFKLKLSGVMNFKSGQMILATKGKTELEDDEDWIGGFRSPLLALTKEDVAAELITEAHFIALTKYAKHWQKVCDEEGRDAMYSKSHSRERLWLTADNEDFLFQFQMVLRTNPKDDTQAIGISEIEWSNATLIGFGTQATPQRIGKAAAQRKGKGVNIPSVRPTVIDEEETVTI